MVAVEKYAKGNKSVTKKDAGQDVFDLWPCVVGYSLLYRLLVYASYLKVRKQASDELHIVELVYYTHSDYNLWLRYDKSSLDLVFEDVFEG